MLNAIAKKNYNVLLGNKEDTLTSTVFDYLLMLPDHLIWRIIKESCYDSEQLPSHLGKLLDFTFWPKWNTSQNDEVSNKSYIEPDVFLEFENHHIIIEAKRSDYNTQNTTQWENQINTYTKQYKDDKKQLIYFAVGGIRTEETATFKNPDQAVYKIRWQSILDTLNNTKRSLEHNADILPNNSYLRIIDTIIKALALHGYHNLKWFKDFKKVEINNTKTIKKWTIKN